MFEQDACRPSGMLGGKMAKRDSQEQSGKLGGTNGVVSCVDD